MSAKLTIAKNERGEIITIEKAAKGKKCNCFCPICNAPLIAKNKVPISLAKHIHHFAHHKGCLCTANDETVRHRWAKDVLLEQKALKLPEGNVRISSGLIYFQNVEIEKWDETHRFRPDAEVTLVNGEKLLVEFYVSHKVSAKKRKIIRKNNLNCIEINLNHVELDKDAIRSFLLNETSYREWIGQSEEKKEQHLVEQHCEEWDDEECCYEDYGIKEINFDKWRIEGDIERQEFLIRPIEENECQTIEQSNQIKHAQVRADTQEEVYITPEKRSCFNCKYNFSNVDGWAYCGPYITAGLSKQRVDEPSRAQYCRLYKRGSNFL